ncbi:hypothetical protein COBT_003913, partial [Conglomerata obtusa]
IINDHGKGFVNSRFEKICRDNKIDHHKISIESHNSKGRIERVIRTIREGIYKATKDTIVNKVRMALNAYNRTYHEAIKMTPREAIKDKRNDLENSNSRYSEYSKRSKDKNKIKFKIGQKVILCKRENSTGTQIKEKIGRFNEKGIIMNILANDSYIVQLIENN